MNFEPPKKVVHIICKFSKNCWGGAETAIVHLSKSLPQFGFASEVWSTDVGSPAGKATLDDVVVVRFPAFYLSEKERAKVGIGKAALSPQLLWGLLRESGASVIHLHCHNRLSSAAAIAAKCRRLPLVLTVHSRYARLQPRWRYYLPNELSAQLADQIICVSGAIRQHIQEFHSRFDPGKIVHIPNGASAAANGGGHGESFRHRYGIPAGPMLLVVGRICELKNQRLLVETFPQVQRAMPQATLVMIGPPSEQDYFARLDALVQRTRNVWLIPGLDPDSQELRDAYAAADLVIVPSREEAFGIVVLEAWAAGKAVLAANVPGLNELIADGSDGRLFSLPAAEQSLAATIVQLLKDSAGLRRMGETGRCKVQAQFSWDRIAERTADVYRDVLQRHGGAHV